VPVLMMVILLLGVFPITPATSVEMRTEYDHDVRITGTRTKPTRDTIGDIDGDGLTDILARYEDDVYVLFGKHISEQDSEIDITTDYSIKFDNTNTEITCLISNVFDFNEDGYDDIFLNVFSHYDFGENFARIMVFYGHSNIERNEIFNIDINGDSNAFSLNITSLPRNISSFGNSILYFDYDKDGYKDLIISDSGNREPGYIRGMIYGFNGENLQGVTNLSYSDYDFRILPELLGETSIHGAFGTYLIIHDFDDDGWEDIIWSQDSAEYLWRDGCGLTLIMYLNGSTLNGNYTLADFQTTHIYGEAGDGFGAEYNGKRIATGDINGDGKNELILSGPGADGVNNNNDRCGEIAILFQRSDRPQNIDLRKRANINVSIIGGKSGEAIGLGSLSAGDYNGDGYDDLLFSNDATYNVAWDGGMYLWLGRDLDDNIYGVSSSKFLIKGQSGEMMERYGYQNTFANLNGDEFMDIIVSPYPGHGDYTDIFYSYNNPPNLLNITFEKKETFRGTSNNITLRINDDRTSLENITIEIQERTDGEWYNLSSTGVEIDSDEIMFDISTEYTSTIGNYSYRLKLTDQDDLSTGWIYYNNSVYVKNNLPEVYVMYPGLTEVGRSFPLRFGIRVNDPETPLDELEFAFRFIGTDRYFGNLTPVRIEEENELHFEFPIPRDMEPGFYHYNILVTDGDGGTTSANRSGGVTIYNCSLGYNDFNIEPLEVYRGEVTYLSFNLFDHDDKIDCLYNVTIDYLHVRSGKIRYFHPDYNGTDYYRTYYDNITIGLDWDIGQYDVHLHSGIWNKTYPKPVMVRNNPPVLMRDNITRYINTSGSTRINITDTVVDIEDGTDLQWNLSDTSLDLPFSYVFNRTGSNTYIDIHVDENVTFNDSINITGSDRDGDAAEVRLLFIINTTKIIEELIDIDITFDVTGPSSSVWSEKTGLNVTLRMENKGNVPVTIELQPLGNGSSYLGSLEDSLVLEPGETVYKNSSFQVVLMEGYNHFGFGVRASYNGIYHECWDNITIIRNIEDLPDPDPEDDIPWFLISVASIALVVVLILIIIIFIFLRKKKQTEQVDLPDEETMNDIFGDHSGTDDGIPLGIYDPVKDEPEPSIPLIPEEQDNPFEEFDLPNDIIEPQNESVDSLAGRINTEE